MIDIELDRELEVVVVVVVVAVGVTVMVVVPGASVTVEVMVATHDEPPTGRTLKWTCVAWEGSSAGEPFIAIAAAAGSF